MITLFTNSKNSKEKEYITHVIFKEFLGLVFCINYYDTQNYELVLPNGSQIIIEDHFFNRFNNEKEYLKPESIPEKITWAVNDFIAEKNIPIIYGTENFEVDKKKIICGVDIFASSFFMLTRWEEYVKKVRDKHHRFPARASLACKNNLLDRPVVNEYAEMLWNMLLFLGYKGERKKRKPKLLLTHDVDNPLKYRYLRTNFGQIFKKAFHQRNFTEAFKNMIEKLQVHLGLKKDPFNTFDYLMEQSENFNLKSHFFFMGTGTSFYDNHYSLHNPVVLNLYKEIISRGHEVGFHPSYNTFDDAKQFAREKMEVENALEQKVLFGRQHCLRFQAPFTWKIWDNLNMLWDSTLSYASREGFRCGTCYEYPVYDFLEQKQLKLRERPLIVMEGSFFSYQPELSSIDIFNKIKSLMNKVKKFNGIFVLLWHNSSLETSENKKLYQNIIRCWYE